MSAEAGAHPRPDVAPSPPKPPPIAWPPPGLGRLQGDVFAAVRWLAAGAFLILPLLWAVVATRDPWSLGPLGETIWLALALGTVGVPVLITGYVVLTRLVGRTVLALEQGHRWRVVALVASDLRRDTGFLLQGARVYEAMTPRLRRSLARSRLTVAGLCLFASLWLSLGFGLSVVLAARGVLGPAGLAVLTLAPSIVGITLAALAYGWEELVLRRVRRRWFRKPWREDLVRDEVRAWTEAMSREAPGVLGRGGEDGSEEARTDRARFALRAANVGLGVLAFVAFMPVFALVFSAAILPLLTRMAVPDLEESRASYAALEPLRRFALEPDPSIGAAEAGERLHVLSFVGRPYRASEGVLPPARTYDDPWFPPDSPGGLAPLEWVQRLTEGMGEPLDGPAVAYLERVADHPAHRELEALARAGTLDVAAVRWSMPLPSDLTMAELGIPPLGPVRRGAYAHLASAAVAAHQGRTAEAEEDLRELISVGLLMADQGPTVFDNLVGMVMAGMGGQALENLYRSTGAPEAEALGWSRRTAARAVERARAGSPRDSETRLRAMPMGALDPDLFRGARWEYVTLLNTLAPCMNLRRVVFGPDADYDAWLESARAGLVRSPAEAELFEVARGGLLGGKLDEPPTLPTRILALTMGGADRPGSCARVFGELVDF